MMKAYSLGMLAGLLLSTGMIKHSFICFFLGLFILMVANRQKEPVE